MIIRIMYPMRSPEFQHGMPRLLRCQKSSMAEENPPAVVDSFPIEIPILVGGLENNDIM